jgi:hypothetical protein
MKITLSQGKFAELCGISVRQLRKDIVSGKLNKEPNGSLDPDDETNKEYIESRHTTNKPKQGKVGKNRKDVIDTEQEIKTVTSLEIQKQEADIAYKHEQTLHVRQRRLKDIGTLVMRSIVTQFMSKMASAIRLHILASLPDRIYNKLLKQFKDDHIKFEVLKILRTEIEKSVQKVKDESKLDEDSYL